MLSNLATKILGPLVEAKEDLGPPRIQGPFDPVSAIKYRIKARPCPNVKETGNYRGYESLNPKPYNGVL